MSNEPTPSQEQQPASSRRRSSFVDMLSSRPAATSPQQGRRLSITTLGISAMPQGSTSPFSTMRQRAESVSSVNSGSVDESPFEDDGPAMSGYNMSASVPATPFARRMSFGGRAMRGSAPVAGGNGQNGSSAGTSANGRTPVSSSAQPAGLANKTPTSSPSLKSREGFDFAENMRARAERSSISAGAFSTGQATQPHHHRAKSVATLEPPKAELPKRAQRPDAFQERILKGDFYMD